MKIFATKLSRGKRLNLAERELFEYLTTCVFLIYEETTRIKIEEDISNELISSFPYKDTWDLKFSYNENGYDCYIVKRIKS